MKAQFSIAGSVISAMLAGAISWLKFEKLAFDPWYTAIFFFLCMMSVYLLTIPFFRFWTYFEVGDDNRRQARAALKSAAWISVLALSATTVLLMLVEVKFQRDPTPGITWSLGLPGVLVFILFCGALAQFSRSFNKYLLVSLKKES